MGDDENEKEFNTYLNKEDVDFFGEGGHLDNTWNQISNFAQRDDALEQVGKGAANFVEDTASGYFSTWGRLAEGAKENAGTGGNGLNDNNLTKGSDLFPKVENPLGKGAIDGAATLLFGGGMAVTESIGLGLDQFREDGYRDQRKEQQKELFDFSGDLVDRPAPPKGGFNTANKMPICTQWASMQCACGTFFTKLLVPVPHRVFIGDAAHPVATINDWKPVFNIPGFGLCWNILNPVVLAQTIAFRQATGIPMTIPAECSATMFPSPWKPMQQNEFIGGVPKLVQTCTSNCWGLGTIFFAHCGQGATPKPYNLISAFAGPDNASMLRGFMNIAGNILGNAAAGFAVGGKFLVASILGAGEILTHFGDAIGAVYQEDGLGAVISLITGFHSTRKAVVDVHPTHVMPGKGKVFEWKSPIRNRNRFETDADAVKTGRRSLDDLDPTSRALYEAFYPEGKKAKTTTKGKEGKKAATPNEKSATPKDKTTKQEKKATTPKDGTTENKNKSNKERRREAHEKIEKRIEELEQKKKDLKEDINTQNELIKKEKEKIEGYKKQIEEKKGKIKELEEKKKAAKNSETELVEQNNKLKQENTVLTQKIKDNNTKIGENKKKIGNENSGLTKEKNQLESKKKKLEGQRDKEIEPIQADYIKEKKKLEKERDQAIAQFMRDKDSLGLTPEEFNNHLESIKEFYAADINKLTQDFEKKKATITNKYKKDIDDTQKKLDKTNSQIEQLTNENTRLGNENITHQATIDANGEMIGKNKEKIKTSQTQQQTIESQITLLNEEIGGKDGKGGLNGQIAASETKTDGYKEKIKKDNEAIKGYDKDIRYEHWALDKTDTSGFNHWNDKGEWADLATNSASTVGTAAATNSSAIAASYNSHQAEEEENNKDEGPTCNPDNSNDDIDGLSSDKYVLYYNGGDNKPPK